MVVIDFKNRIFFSNTYACLDFTDSNKVELGYEKPILALRNKYSLSVLMCVQDINSNFQKSIQIFYRFL